MDEATSEIIWSSQEKLQTYSFSLYLSKLSTTFGCGQICKMDWNAMEKTTGSWNDVQK